MLRFLHTTTTYVFQGERLPTPDPSTYDSAVWTPPTHKIYRVEFQSDSSGWWLLLGATGHAVVDRGDHHGRPSREVAKGIVEKFIQRTTV